MTVDTAKFEAYYDPEYRKVQRTLKAPIPYKAVRVAQFDINSYYRANIKDKGKPMFMQVSR
jgi:hypothetical protein